MPQANKFLRKISPFTNAGSLMFPWARIRGASLQERFWQTYEIFSGRYFSGYGNKKHFGIVHFLLVVPLALLLLAHALDALHSLIFGLNSQDKTTSRLGYLVAFAIIGPIIVVDIIIHALIVQPISALLTVLCTPLILLTHLTCWATNPNVHQLINDLLEPGQEKHANFELDYAPVITSASYSRVLLCLTGQPDSPGLIVKYRPEDAHNNSDAIIQTDKQKAALQQLLSCNAYHFAQDMDLYFKYWQPNQVEKQCGMRLSAF